MRFRLTFAALGLLMVIKPAGAQAQEPDGTDIGKAIPTYFSQVIEDIIDKTTRPDQVYAITLARGQELMARWEILI